MCIWIAYLLPTILLVTTLCKNTLHPTCTIEGGLPPGMGSRGCMVQGYRGIGSSRYQ